MPGTLPIPLRSGPWQIAREAFTSSGCDELFAFSTEPGGTYAMKPALGL